MRRPKFRVFVHSRFRDRFRAAQGEDNEDRSASAVLTSRRRTTFVPGTRHACATSQNAPIARRARRRRTAAEDGTPPSKMSQRAEDGIAQQRAIFEHFEHFECPGHHTRSTRCDRTNVHDAVNPHDQPAAKVRGPASARQLGARNRRPVRRELCPTFPADFRTINGLEIASVMTRSLAQKLPESARKCHQNRALLVTASLTAISRCVDESHSPRPVRPQRRQ